MTGRQGYAYGIGDGTVHDGEVLRYGGRHNGHIHTTAVDHGSGEFAGTVAFENESGNEGNNK